MKTIAVALAALLTLLTTAAVAGDMMPTVTLETSSGLIVLELDDKRAPETTRNFLEYVEDGHYDGLIFHRVIGGFMIQGGGYDNEYEKRRTRDPIQNESRNGLSNLRGSIAMARTMNPHSATSQFFINHADNPRLDATDVTWGYTVFGKVTAGMDVVDAIADVETGSDGPFGRDVPVDMITIERAYTGTTPPPDAESADNAAEKTSDGKESDSDD